MIKWLSEVENQLKAIAVVALLALAAMAVRVIDRPDKYGIWVNTSDPSSIIEVARNHIIHRVDGVSTVFQTGTRDLKYMNIGEDKCTMEVNGDTLIIGGGRLAGSYRRMNTESTTPAPPPPAASVLLGQKLTAYTQKIQSLRDKYKILEKDRLDLTAALAQLGIRSSSDLTTTKSRQLATELAEVVVQQQELQAQFSDVQRTIDEGQSLQRRLAREELINDGKISSEELRQQSDETIELLAKLDQKFQNTGTVNTQQAIDKIVDEQLQKK